MPPTYSAHAVPQNAYPTPARFVGAVLRFFVIAALDRLTRGAIARLGRKQAQAAPQADQRAPDSDRGYRRVHR